MEQYRYKELTGFDTDGIHGIANVEITTIDKSKSNVKMTLLEYINQEGFKGWKAVKVTRQDKFWFVLLENKID